MRYGYSIDLLKYMSLNPNGLMLDYIKGTVIFFASYRRSDSWVMSTTTGATRTAAFSAPSSCRVYAATDRIWHKLGGRCCNASGRNRDQRPFAVRAKALLVKLIAVIVGDTKATRWLTIV